MHTGRVLGQLGVRPDDQGVQAIPLLQREHSAAQDRQVHEPARAEDLPRSERARPRSGGPCLLLLCLFHLHPRLLKHVFRAARAGDGRVQNANRCHHHARTCALRCDRRGMPRMSRVREAATARYAHGTAYYAASSSEAR